MSDLRRDIENRSHQDPGYRFSNLVILTVQHWLINLGSLSHIGMLGPIGIQLVASYILIGRYTGQVFAESPRHEIHY